MTKQFFFFFPQKSFWILHLFQYYMSLQKWSSFDNRAFSRFCPHFARSWNHAVKSNLSTQLPNFFLNCGRYVLYLKKNTLFTVICPHESGLVSKIESFLSDFQRFWRIFDHQIKKHLSVFRILRYVPTIFGLNPLGTCQAYTYPTWQTNFQTFLSIFAFFGTFGAFLEKKTADLPKTPQNRDFDGT